MYTHMYLLTFEPGDQISLSNKKLPLLLCIQENQEQGQVTRRRRFGSLNVKNGKAKQQAVGRENPEEAPPMCFLEKPLCRTYLWNQILPRVRIQRFSFIATFGFMWSMFLVGCDCIPFCAVLVLLIVTWENILPCSSFDFPFSKNYFFKISFFNAYFLIK